MIGDITTREERGGVMGIFQAGLLMPLGACHVDKSRFADHSYRTCAGRDLCPDTRLESNLLVSHHLGRSVPHSAHPLSA